MQLLERRNIDMKKIVLAVLLAMAAGMAAAQGYVRIDTVIRPYIEFDYQGWRDSGNWAM